MKKLLTSVAFALTGLCASAYAGNLVTNGGFESAPNGGGQLGWNTNATGWSTNGYNFLFTPGTADTSGVPGFYNSLSLWGQNNGGTNALVASPDGGNFVGADGAFWVAPLQQTINGLVVGQQYNVNFYWAGAQQSGFTGATTEQWTVTLGNQTLSTPIVNNANHGFTGWMAETLTFTATNTSEVLSFLAHGTPDGEPPFSLLDGVSVTEVPEPGVVWNMVIGACGLAAIGLFRRRAKQG